jgi:CRISPR-associated protein Cmr1
MKYLLQSNTPIWTGGATRICDTIHEAGIIGSLRWWYEVVLRGLDVFACDPTMDTGTDKRCPIELNEDKKWCNACNLFGMTGLQRKFKININRGKQVYEQTDQKQNINIKPSRCDPPRTTGWFLGAGRIATDQKGLALLVTPLTSSEYTSNTLEVLLCLLSKWGGIGARQQHGYGIFEIFCEKLQNGLSKEEKLNKFINASKSPAENQPPKRRTTAISADMPNLKNFFFAKIKLDGLTVNWENDLDGVPAITNERKRFDEWHNHTSRIFAPALKNQLRFVAFKDDTGKQKKLFGNIKDKSGAKVNVSHIYDANGNKEVRVWGDIQDASLRNEFYIALNNTTYWQNATGCPQVIAQVTDWREKNGTMSSRCRKAGSICTAPCTDVESFLKCLLLGDL